MIIKYNIPYYPSNVKKDLNLAFKNNKLTDGIIRDKTEKYLEKIINSKKIFLTQSCTNALEACISICNIGHGDEVIIPSYTFTSTANCVLLNSATPVYADIDLRTLNLDPRDIENKITKKTRAFIVVHYNGYNHFMEEYVKLSKKYNIYMIEDCAHSVTSTFKNKFLGTFGDLGAFSFHETKNFPSGQGGALSVNNKSLLRRAVIYCDKGTNRTMKGKKGFYSWKGVGSEIRATEITSSIIYSQLKSSNYIIEKRKKIWNMYFNFLNKINQKLFYLPSYNLDFLKISYHIFPIIFFKKNLRLKFEKYMLKKSVECFFHYYPLHLSTFGKKYFQKKLPNTTKVYHGLVRLPIYPSLKNLQILKIIKEIKNFINLYDFK